MGLGSKASSSESRFAFYVEAITSMLGHADRVAPFQSYCAGLLLPGDRKSIEPIAARMQPGRVQAARQSLHHFVAKAEWSDAEPCHVESQKAAAVPQAATAVSLRQALDSSAAYR